METAQEYMVMVAYVAALALLLFVVAWVMVVLTKFTAYLNLRLKQIDQVLVPLGKTPIGQAANQYLTNFLPRVDQADDPLIQSAMAIPLLKRLHEAGVITAEELSR